MKAKSGDQFSVPNLLSPAVESDTADHHFSQEASGKSHIVFYFLSHIPCWTLKCWDALVSFLDSEVTVSRGAHERGREDRRGAKGAGGAGRELRENGSELECGFIQPGPRGSSGV